MWPDAEFADDDEAFRKSDSSFEYLRNFSLWAERFRQYISFESPQYEGWPYDLTPQFLTNPPIAMRPITICHPVRTAAGGCHTISLKMFELVREDLSRLYLYTDLDRWDRMAGFAIDDEETDQYPSWMIQACQTDDEDRYVLSTLAKLVPCFKEEMIPLSEWERYEQDPIPLRMDQYAFRYFLHAESLGRKGCRLPNRGCISSEASGWQGVLTFFDRILRAWESDLAESIIEPECYEKHWRPQMDEMLEAYRRRKTEDLFRNIGRIL